MSLRPLNVLVCGSTFGQFWLAALQRAPQRFVIAGLLANGSARSRDCAARHGIPLYTSLDALPDNIDIACVVLRASVLGGEGSERAQQLMARGIHVIQEQPVHHDEVVANLRCARQHGVHYRVGNLYPHLPAVQQFSDAAQRLLRRQKPQFIDAACASQVAFPLVSMLTACLGVPRPWQFTAQPLSDGPFQVVQGRIADIPFTLRVHNEVDPDDPDNHVQLLQQITLGFPAGRLVLADTHGPVMWHPRLHIPETVKRDYDFSHPQSAHLMEETHAIVGDAQGTSWRTTLTTHWPAAIAVDLLALAEEVQQQDAPYWSPQILLTQCQMWQALTTALGYPRLQPGQQFQPLARTLLPATRGEKDPTPSALPAFCRRAETRIRDIRAREIADFVSLMDEACLNAMLFSLQQGGVLVQADQGSERHALMQQLQVDPQHYALIGRWLTLLVDAGLIAQRGQHYFSRTVIDESRVNASWQAVHRVWDNRLGSATFIDYLWRNVEKLGALMRGEQQAALLLFPEGRCDIADAVYRHTITARYLNTLIADWTMAQLAQQTHALQVLEIGAGTGATTECVRECLQAEYGDTPLLHWLFSDVSRFFLLNAQQRYGDLPWLSTALLDIDQSLIAQGIAPDSQDLLVMAGVLNNAQNSEQTIRWLAQVLRPGGHMLITEPTREHLEILISQAFMMPPPEDDRQRSEQRFLTPSQWQDLFQRAGLLCLSCLPADDHVLAPLGQRLFIVRRPADA